MGTKQQCPYTKRRTNKNQTKCQVKNKLEILQLINTAQNNNNYFVNIDVDDLNKIEQHINKHDLDLNETLELIIRTRLRIMDLYRLEQINQLEGRKKDLLKELNNKLNSMDLMEQIWLLEDIVNE